MLSRTNTNFSSKSKISNIQFKGNYIGPNAPELKAIRDIIISRLPEDCTARVRIKNSKLFDKNLVKFLFIRATGEAGLLKIRLPLSKPFINLSCFTLKKFFNN